MFENERERYDSFMGLGPKRIVHIEHWSNPDAESFITGIDYYENPKLCREKINKLYPYLFLNIPVTNDPKPRLESNRDNEVDEQTHTTRWGDGQTATFEHGEVFFKSADDVFAFSPLAKLDFTDWPHVVMNRDYTSEDTIFPDNPSNLNPVPEGECRIAGFYNTMFMWPMLTFGWELFLECCMDPRFERIMDEFAELSRRAFKAIAKRPVNIVFSHDDIVMSSGPVCSPQWMHKYIFPRYEEFWGILKAAGKRVVFMVDGCVDVFVDDIMACGASGFISEPYTNFKAIAGKYENCVLAGEGDNRILMRNNPVEIRKMVKNMVETGKMSGGYLMCIGNHIPWNVPPEAVKYYLDCCQEFAYR